MMKVTSDIIFLGSKLLSEKNLSKINSIPALDFFVKLIEFFKQPSFVYVTENFSRFGMGITS